MIRDTVRPTPPISPDTSGGAVYERFKAEPDTLLIAVVDALTDLSNRALFHQQLEAALTQARRPDRQAAVFCVDLDRFESVNDTLGHAAGDALLRAAADVRQVGRGGGAADEAARPCAAFTPVAWVSGKPAHSGEPAQKPLSAAP